MKPARIGDEIASLASDRTQEKFATGAIPSHVAESLLSPAQLGSFLAHPLLRFPQARVTLDGKAVNSADYVMRRRMGTRTVDDAIDAHQIARWLTRGATMTLDSLEYLSEPIRELCLSLTTNLGLPATASAYVTPPGRRGLRPHTDEEDVFVVQTFGAKSWVVDSHQRQEVATAAGFPMNDRMRNVPPRVLSPGDMFFMPAGTPHVAESHSDLSIHITFSVERPRVRDVLAHALESVAVISHELNRLQSWDPAQQLSVAEVAQKIGEVPSSALRAKELCPRARLPFDSWARLSRPTLRLRALGDLSVAKSEDGFSLDFSEFRLKVNRRIGATLAPLASGTIQIEPSDDELREVLFHLIGREVVEVADMAGG